MFSFWVSQLCFFVLQNVHSSKKNKIGVISIQVIDKNNGKNKLLKTIVSSSDQLKINQLVIDAEFWIKKS